MNRARFIISTGGGKTLNEYYTLHRGFFDLDFDLQCIVAPTIDLLKQHDETFTGYGMFHQDGVVRVHFRTGDEACKDAHVPYYQTTSPGELLEVFAKHENDKVLIFVTYASVKKLLDFLAKVERKVDACAWDEFHHLAIQTQEQKRWLLKLWPTLNLFFSASEKRGRIVSTLDEDLFGPKLADIGYPRLRNDGILVSKIVIKPIRLNESGKRAKALSREMKKSAERNGFDLKDATLEAAGIIVAHRDMVSTVGTANIVAFSQQVAVCKAIVASQAVKDELDGVLLQTVHAAVPGHERREVYDRIKSSTSSVLDQHSIVKEGIDITCFNALVMARNMEVIGVQQAIGRIVRADPRDTEALQAGRISLDSPKGWHKYAATVYVIVSDEDANDFRLWLRGFIEKMTLSGFSPSDYQFADLVEERHGKKQEDTDWIVPLMSKTELEAENLKGIVKNLIIEIENEEAHEQSMNRCSKMSNLELLEAACAAS